MRFKHLSLILFLFIIASKLSAADISGKIIDPQGKPIPFANVFIKGTSIGTTSNLDGNYSITLSPGHYELIYKTIGYKQVIKSVEVNITPQQIDVTLEPEIYELKEVSVSAGAEDPAFEIMRNAIKKRKHYLNQVSAYSCEVYIKALQRLKDAPKKFLGTNIDDIGQRFGLDSNRRGIIYLSESESKFNFQRPNKIHEEMISSKVSGRSNGFSFNQASDILINFYDNAIELAGISPRGLVSPLADNALFYYTYKLIGCSYENNQLINKIQVIPRRKNDPVFRGYIYIMEDSWRLHSTDLLLTHDAQIQLLDSLTIQQQFFPVKGEVWMPASQKLMFNGGLLGFKFAGNYIGVYKNYILEPKFEKGFFTGEVLNVSKESNKRDQNYWAQNRPIPLTSEEQHDYAKKDSIEVLRKSEPYLDSIDHKRNKFTPGKLFLGGYTYQNSFNKTSIIFSSILPSNLQFNTVEGVNLTLQASYRKVLENRKNFNITPELRYGFSNHHLNGNISFFYHYDPSKIGSMNLSIGTDVVDFNDKGSLAPLVNSYATLVNQTNYLKLYEKQFADFTLTQEVANGIQLSGSLAYVNRLPLINTNFYSFSSDSIKLFTANNPYYGYDNEPAFEKNQALTFTFSSTFSFGSEYITRPGGKFYMGSKWPKLNLLYRKGIQLLGSDVNYNFMSARIYDSGLRLGLWGNSAFSISAGKFLSAKHLYYMDYQHFKGNRMGVYAGSSTNIFRFLDYYAYSTSNQFLEGHFEHNFSGFFMNKIPLLRKLRLEEIAGANYLSSDKIKNYNECYIGIQRLMFRAEVGWAWQDGEKQEVGFRLSTSF
ncbi:DUF5686 and carboxypeptidase regulatory-like domain-containing protein [Solitalea koreensis]|uniref:CarboxypepD_reg-like domain-containing protein n=1 Tax=Solitalea koreensis TaxID=543615 RepID=A0A521CJU3_9SPHI|nr:DUF5686 and carboxypeptidase regulatory-like domain-containing protein [Solitalea koreensis]SMO59708.1 CarboxypepD_reg-like domain-containing protein [Solitalea koreensis]